MERKSKNFVSIIEIFRPVPDPRIDRTKRYDLIEIIFLTICAVLSGFETWEEIEDFGNEKLAWLQKYLPYEQGIPSHDTINRVMSMINHKVFEECFINWATHGLILPGGTQISIDGKKLRGSATKKEQQTAYAQGGKQAIHTVHAWCNDLQMCLGQYQVADKANEIIAIPALLDFLELEGTIVTIDAIGCQKEIAAKIREKKADYIFGLKDNQEKLSMGALEAFESRNIWSQRDYDEQDDKGHGRLEKRICRILPASELPKWAGAEAWPDLRCIVEIQAERIDKASGKIEEEIRYYISSLDVDAETYNKRIRSHWGIENRLHWVLDVEFGEDLSRKRIRNAAQNFSIIRKIALNMVRANTEKISVNRKRNKCALSDDYRAKMLGL
jgi:predicted transposase YbfD/YdcC